MQVAAAGIAKAYTGHTHLPQKFTRAGVEVIVTGSMQPMAHGEDPDERFYMTRSLTEVEAVRTPGRPGYFGSVTITSFPSPAENIRTASGIEVFSRSIVRDREYAIT